MSKTPGTDSTVSQRYDELADLLAWWRSVEPAVPLDDDLDVARRAIVSEARLLDDGRLDEWLDGWAPDGILWVPIEPATHPGTDQAYLLDDVRRLRERVRWRRLPSAWSQSPPAWTVRTIGNIESHRTADGALYVRSSITIAAQRLRSGHLWAGHQFHVLDAADGDDRPRRIKVLSIPELRAAVSRPEVLL